MKNSFYIDMEYTIRQPLVIYGFVTLLISVLIFSVSLFVWYPVNDEYLKKETNRLFEKNKYIDLLNIKKLSTTYDKAKSNSELLSSKLRLDTSQSKIITNLAAITSSNHIRVNKESYQEIKKKHHLLLRHDLLVEGTYANIKKMVSDIQALPYLAYIKSAKFETKKTSGVLQVKLSVVSFLRFVKNGE